MARMRKLFFSNCSMMSPIALRRTASGLTMVNVRCRVFISSVVVLGFKSETLLHKTVPFLYALNPDSVQQATL